MDKKLIDYGFNRGFIESLDYRLLEQHEIARVTAVNKDSYMVTNGEIDVFAELVGKAAFSASSATDYPAVGDWVLVNFHDNQTFGLIHEILPRTSLLKRKTPGKKIDFQVIAANIDSAFIIQSLNENFNIRRLERYLVMSNESNIKPLVLLSKSDLVSPAEVNGKIHEIKKIMPHVTVAHYSSENQAGLKHVESILEPGHTYCLLGSSGVGKTTLLNKLIGEAVFETRTVSKKESKGRHATTQRQLIKMAGGAMIVDTPGMRELGNFSIEKGLEETFTEITTLSENCFFSDCTHVNEKGCAVLEAISNGQISADRLKSYEKMTRESNYNQMSYLEKKNKDKQFGKMCKKIMKDKKSRR